MPPRLARFVIGAALVVASPFVSVIAAQVPAPEYAARRATLLSKIDSGIVIAYGEVEPVTDFPTFFQLPHFQYLTGFGESNARAL